MDVELIMSERMEGGKQLEDGEERGRKERRNVKL